MDNNILITGGTGMVGKHLQNILPNAYYLGSEIDLRNINEVDLLFKYNKFNRVVHLAAKVGGIKDNINNPGDYFDDNILMNTNIVKVSKKYKVKRFLGILSTCIYPDKVNNYPMKEEILHLGPPTPSNFSYGYAKRCLAVQIDAYNKQFGTEYNYIIPTNLYSEYDNFDNDNKMHFVTALLKKIKNSKNNIIELFGDGSPLRQFIYAEDLAKIIKLIIDNDITESFNVSNTENLSIDEMANIALQEVGKEYKIHYIYPHLNGQLRKDVCNEKLMNIFPNFKFTSFKEGIKKVYDKIS